MEILFWGSIGSSAIGGNSAAGNIKHALLMYAYSSIIEYNNDSLLKLSDIKGNFLSDKYPIDNSCNIVKKTSLREFY